MPINTALIAEYLSIRTQKHSELGSDGLQHLNCMMLQLAMELPLDLWRAILSGLETSPKAGVWDAVAAVRSATGAEGAIEISDRHWHGPEPR